MDVSISVRAYIRSTDKEFEIGHLVENLKVHYYLEGNAGSMEFSYIENSDIDLTEGDVIQLTVNGNKFFYGWVFSKTISYNDSIKIKCYDSKRYLAYTDVDVTGNETIDKFFERVCKMAKMSYKVVDKSSYIIPTKIHDGVSYNDMLQYGIDQTFIGTKRNERFCVRSNGKNLELIECSKHVVQGSEKDTQLVLKEQSLLTGYEFKTDIENTYTAFKVQREIDSEEQKKLSESQKIMQRKTLTDKDDENIKKWGVMQYYEKKDAKWTDAQLQQHISLLKVTKNRKTKSMKVDALGDLGCIPGNLVRFVLQKLKNEEIFKVSNDTAQEKLVLITEAEHTFSHNEHTMNLTLEVW